MSCLRDDLYEDAILQWSCLYYDVYFLQLKTFDPNLLFHDYQISRTACATKVTYRPFGLAICYTLVLLLASFDNL